MPQYKNTPHKSQSYPPRQCVVCGGDYRTRDKRQICCSYKCAARRATYGTPVERFWAKVVKTESCWFWVASKNSDGYGNFKVNGKNEKAHIFSYILAYGNYNRKLYVRHTCDNPGCVRPTHLKLGTQKDNMTDMYSRGRGHWQSK